MTPTTRPSPAIFHIARGALGAAARSGGFSIRYEASSMTTANIASCTMPGTQVASSAPSEVPSIPGRLKPTRRNCALPASAMLPTMNKDPAIATFSS